MNIGKAAYKIKMPNEIIDLDITVALARTHYQRMLRYATQSNPEYRKQYDYDKQAADQYLKALLKQERRNGELFRIAILFYVHRYNELSSHIPSEQKMRGQLKKIILEKLGPLLFALPQSTLRDKRP